MHNPVSIQPVYLSWSGAAVSFFFLLCALFFGIGSNSTVYTGVALAAGLALAYSLIAVGKAHFAQRQIQEEESQREQQGKLEHSELFTDSADDAVQLARRLHRHYTAYAIPALALLAAVLVGFSALYFWRRYDPRLMEPALREPFRYALISLGVFIVALLGGSYFVGKSREPACRWLRPVGAIWVFTGFLYLLAGVTLIAIQWNPEYAVWDIYLGMGVLATVMALAAEAIIAVVIDFYRPRVPGETPRPSYESRILTIFTEPGGIARNIALSLDYQFGFEVSEARFYHFLERTMIPLLIFMAAGLWAMTCFVVIDSDESGVRERFGRVVEGREEAMGPGFYFKLPLPFERIHTFPTGRIQTIPIGYKPAENGRLDEYADVAPMEDTSGRVILWSEAHNIEETIFVVAADSDEEFLPQRTLPDRVVESRPVPVYFMSASIPLYYEVTDLYTYLYKHRDAMLQLEQLATREVVAYLASVDFYRILTDRRQAADILKRRIQEAASRADLGVQISFVGLEGLHPPVTVGGAFDEVVSAAEEKHTQILLAEQYGIQRRPQARSESFNLQAEAEKYKLNRVGLAEAEGERFLSQLQAFQTAPELYPLRAYLDIIETETRGIRKYIVGLPDADQVMILNLEEQLRPDLMDIDLRSIE